MTNTKSIRCTNRMCIVSQRLKNTRNMSLAISITLISEVIVGALSFTGISYDGHTLEAVLQKNKQILLEKWQQK
ncbi:hypothetical protein [Arachidicoccus soli]|uniref:hypothetical protein n=1 Tax=Arachidicoccus soli TaxID=2341117 RepID=UPI0013C488F2|nr:hypothetical protein [Arachidicoccus soli]